jgi:Fe-S cluster assembly ATP-binding protein
MLIIQDLHVSSEDKPILKGINLQIEQGEIHAVMGPNGAGKSTLAKVIAGDPSYEVTAGKILFEGHDILELQPEERAHLGLFMSFQYPLEIPGITNFQFLHAAKNALRKSRDQAPLSEVEFGRFLDEKLKLMQMKEEFKWRHLNEGFSGGEKKRNEILQMAVLEPTLAILDETDSGLDIDAMRDVSCSVNQLLNADNALLLITHYQRLLDYIRPDYVHVMIEGQIVHSGKAALALELEEKGYDWLMPCKHS